MPGIILPYHRRRGTLDDLSADVHALSAMSRYLDSVAFGNDTFTGEIYYDGKEVQIEHYMRHALRNARRDLNLGWAVKWMDFGDDETESLENAQKNKIAWVSMHPNASDEAIQDAIAASSAWGGANTVRRVEIVGSMVKGSRSSKGYRFGYEAVFKPGEHEKIREFGERMVRLGIKRLFCSPHELRILSGAGFARRLALAVVNCYPESAPCPHSTDTITPSEAAGLGAAQIVVGEPIWEAGDDTDMVDAARRMYEAATGAAVPA